MAKRSNFTFVVRKTRRNAAEPCVGGPESTRGRYLQLMATGPSLERTVAFSDAVFAIAMTILVLELHVPAVETAQLPQAVLGLLPAYLTFVLSFAVVGMVWLSHHRKFAVIERFDQNLLRLNLLVLVLVASVSLPTALLGEFGDSIFAASLYAGLICAIGFAMVGLWAYACRRGLVAKAVDRSLRRYVVMQSLVIPVVFLVSIPVALLAGATAAELSWAAAIPVSIVLPRLWARQTASTRRKNDFGDIPGKSG